MKRPIYEKTHPHLVTCFKRSDGRVCCFAFMGSERWVLPLNLAPPGGR